MHPARASGDKRDERMNGAPLEADRLTRKFGQFTAVDGISFQARSAEILAFLGANGAGKTTLFKMIMGLLRPTSGAFRIHGRAAPPAGRGAGLGYMSQRFSLYPLLTGLENVEFLGGISGLPKTDIRRKKEEIREQVPAEILGLKVRDIPTGFRQRIALFSCLMAEPEIVLLDEPTAGAGPALRRDIWRDLMGLKKAGRTILIATHHLAEASRADRILIIDRGRLVVEGPPDELVRSSPGRTLAGVYQEALRDEPRT
jgi:drug efflux transport system ATP-binding protein